jgi:uncharacterized protein with NRDE domain
VCLLAVAWQVHPAYRLVVAANRDEFYERATSAAHWWADHPDVFAGVDERAGGTWMGVTRDGRFAALTNVRRAEDDEGRDGRPSRGELVSGFLTGAATAAEYAASVDASRFNGFNLLVADADALWWCGTQGPASPLDAGVYGLANASLDTPWPRTVSLTATMRAALQHEPIDRDALWTGLADRTVPADDDLPHSDLPAERRRQLGSCLIVTDDYGTRSSSIVTVDHDGTTTMTERTLDGDGLTTQTVSTV